MYQLSACIEWLFAEQNRPFEDRIRAAADAGVPSVEFWTWQDKDMKAIRNASQTTGVIVNAFCVDPPGVLIEPETHDVFLAGLRESIAIATDFGTKKLVVTAGNADPNASRDSQQIALIEGLRRGAEFAEAAGVTIVLEPLNTLVDHPGHFLWDTAEAFDIVRAVDSAHVKLLYDAYHSVVMGEDPDSVLDGNMPAVAHIQIADNPGRHEPGTGHDDWEKHLTTFRRHGYDGLIGLEYVPVAESAASLDTIRSIADRT